MKARTAANRPIFMVLLSVAIVGITAVYLAGSVGLPLHNANATGNKNTPDFWCTNYDKGVKFDEPEDGTMEGITADFDENQESVDISSAVGLEIALVVVKAGSDGGDDGHGNQIYDEGPWSGLTAPDSKKISHVIVCYNEVETQGSGNIIVVKQVTEGSNSSKSFTFETTGEGFDGFSLSADDGSHDSGDLPAGEYSVFEVNPEGWTFKNVVCESTDEEDESTAASIILNEDETITCTFTNKENRINPESETASITVCKMIVNEEGVTSDGSDLSGTFEIEGVEVIGHETVPDSTDVIPTSQFSTPLTLNTDLIGDSENEAECVTYDELEIGSYFYLEESISGDGWNTPLYNDQVSVSIDSLEDFFEYSGELFTPSSEDDDERNRNADGHIVLTKNHPHRTLVILNTFTIEENGNGNGGGGGGDPPDTAVIVQKVTDSPGTEEFEFQASWTENFFVGHGGEFNSGNIATGTLSVEEVNLPGLWKLDSVVCTSSLGGTETNTSINLEEHEIVTCVFSNVEFAGGGGFTGGGRGGGGGSTSQPEGEILAEQIDLVPAGAPDTGAGEVMSMLQMLIAGLFLLFGVFGTVFAISTPRQ